MLDNTHERMLITAQSGATNSISDTAFYDQVIATCDQIYQLLADHCGPKASDALIIQDNDPRNLKDRHYAIFTKDGINIVRSLEFVSPIQRHIQEMIAYIGSRVDALSHDGTTTAMMFFTACLSYHFKQLKAAAERGTRIDRGALARRLIRALKTMAAAFENDVITLKRLQEETGLAAIDATRFVAYHQAMLSSKGDQEMASAIVEVVETLPQELFGYFTVQQSRFETKQRFTVVHDNFDFELAVVPPNLSDMNHNMGTEFLAKRCDVIVCEDDLNHVGNPALGLLGDYIAGLTETPLTRPLVLLVKSMDAKLHGHITALNQQAAHHIVVITLTNPNPYASKITRLTALQHIASVYSLEDAVVDRSLPFVIRGASVHYKNRRVQIGHLYEKDGSQYHPSFTNRDRFPPYTQFVDEIQQALQDFASGRMRVESKLDEARYQDYVEIYRRMVCAEVRNLQISGMRHETLADRDVLQDAFGAALSALEKGFVFDGYQKLLPLTRLPGMGEIGESLATVITDLLVAVHQPEREREFRFDCTGYRVFPSPERWSYRQRPVDQVFAYATIAALKKKSGVWQGGKQTLVMQPADTYRELLTRCLDLLPKLFTTTRAIIPGTVNTGAPL